MYQRVGILDVTWEPRDKAEAQAMLDAGKAMMVNVLSGKESLDEIVCFLDFSTKLSDLLMCVPELSF